MAVETPDMNVATGLWSRSRRFRVTHLTTCGTAEGVEWEYIACGHSDEALPILPGLRGVGEISVEHVPSPDKLPSDRADLPLTLTLPVLVHFDRLRASSGQAGAES